MKIQTITFVVKGLEGDKFLLPAQKIDCELGNAPFDSKFAEAITEKFNDLDFFVNSITISEPTEEA